MGVSRKEKEGNFWAVKLDMYIRLVLLSLLLLFVIVMISRFLVSDNRRYYSPHVLQD